MKFLVSKNHAINLANINDIAISNNYLVLTTDAGLSAREIRFVYGTQAELEKLFQQIMDFISGDEKVFDCDDKMSY